MGLPRVSPCRGFWFDAHKLLEFVGVSFRILEVATGGHGIVNGTYRSQNADARICANSSTGGVCTVEQFVRTLSLIAA